MIFAEPEAINCEVGLAKFPLPETISNSQVSSWVKAISQQENAGDRIWHPTLSEYLEGNIHSFSDVSSTSGSKFVYFLSELLDVVLIHSKHWSQPLSCIIELHKAQPVKLVDHGEKAQKSVPH